MMPLIYQGGGKPGPYPATKRDAEPYRVGAGLAPALVYSNSWWQFRRECQGCELLDIVVNL